MRYAIIIRKRMQYSLYSLAYNNLSESKWRSLKYCCSTINFHEIGQNFFHFGADLFGHLLLLVNW